MVHHDDFFPDTPTMVVSFGWLMVLVVAIPVGIIYYGLLSLWFLEAFLILAMISIVLAIIWWYFRVRAAHPTYSANRTNTLIFSVVMGIVACWRLPTVMRSLETKVWQITADDARIMDAPCVAFVQDFNWNAQAPLSTARMPQCFIGNAHPNLPLCSSLDPNTLRSPQVNCDCSDMWPETVEESFIWHNQPYRVLNFCPSMDLFLTRPMAIMILHVFYDFNVSRAELEEDYYTNPLSNVAIYDPSLTLRIAADQNSTRLIPINANGITSISLIPNRRQYLNKNPVYDYTSTPSSIGAQGLVCDVSNTTGTYWKPCTAAVHVQFSTFAGMTTSEVKQMSPSAAIATVGGWFTFPLLFAAWLSGQAIKAKG
ncbi:hypothetical protein BU16DRAFT_617913 [Lophium mytilinum]|uniref:Uncharacterized protein n=1 Tax=Lophium mytilinum TaxID=390894 RepID=A0A6A6QSE5_9PEZI|nr:hypothetical protein BU16DRAFT_617913 [Lophium mytilinum]